MTVVAALEARVRQLEDRALIAEQVIKYAIGVDRRDWKMFAGCFTDPIYADHSESGLPAAAYPRDTFVGIVSNALNGFTATQHISPNHVIEFNDDDPDRAVCHSYMYAQHYLEGAERGDYFLLRGSYTNYMVRTSGGWRIERIVQHVSWADGNRDAVSEAVARSEARQVSG